MPTGFRELDPPADLAGHVASLWRRDVPTGSATGPALVLPDGCSDIMWLDDGTTVTTLVAGPDTVAQLAALPPGSRMAGLRFVPGAAAAFLGLPLDELRDLRVPLAELWGSAADELAESAAQATRPELALAAAVRCRRDAAPDPSVGAIVRAVEHGTGPGVVGRLAGHLGLSERQLQRRCRTAFGYGPKTLQQVLRFQRALQRARDGDRLADVAAATGYADQAHLARDTRRLAGVPLTALL